jgi:hypothetical protein
MSAFTILRLGLRGGFDRLSSHRSLGACELELEAISLSSFGHPLSEFVVGPAGEFVQSRWSPVTTDPRSAVRP